jgi:hypothetical protein
MQRHHTSHVIRIMTATPPTTPPTIGAIGVPEDVEAWPGKEPTVTHVVVAQELHDSAWREQVSPSAHGGQAGAPGGHFTHRLNMRRRFSSISLPDTIAGEAIVGQLYCGILSSVGPVFTAGLSIVILDMIPGTKDDFEASDETGRVAVALLWALA